jgi:hypothetical protein
MQNPREQYPSTREFIAARFAEAEEHGLVHGSGIYRYIINSELPSVKADIEAARLREQKPRLTLIQGGKE